MSATGLAIIYIIIWWIVLFTILPIDVNRQKSIKDRKNISANGYMEVTILITAKGNIHKRPVLTFRGLPVYDVDEFVYELEEAIEKTTRTFSTKSKKQEFNLIDALKITCRKCAKQLTGKRPFININLVSI